MERWKGMTEEKRGQRSFVICFLDKIDSARLHAVGNDQWSGENRWWQERGHWREWEAVWSTAQAEGLTLENTGRSHTPTGGTDEQRYRYVGSFLVETYENQNLFWLLLFSLWERKISSLAESKNGERWQRSEESGKCELSNRCIYSGHMCMYFFYNVKTIIRLF